MKLSIGRNGWLIIASWAILLFTFGLLRLLLLLNNLNFFKQVSLLDLFMAFIVGIRFDFAIICIFNGLFMLFLSFPVSFPYKYPRLASVIWLITNSLPIIWNAIDIGYFNVSQRRTTYEAFTLLNEIWRFLGNVLQEYALLILLMLIGYFGLHKLIVFIIKRISKFPSRHLPRWFAYGFSPLLVVAIVVIGLRGGLQLKPLRPAMAFFAPEPALGHLASNSAYNILTTLFHQDEHQLAFMSEEDAIKIIKPFLISNNESYTSNPKYPLIRSTHYTQPHKWNVVLILLESFSAEYIDYFRKDTLKLTPHLSRLIEEGVFCEQAYANGKRSIEAPPIIFNSLPNILTNSLIGSDKETHHANGIGNILHKLGYTNAFFHGADNQTMGFLNYCKVSGIQNYFGINEWKGPLNESTTDMVWGIYDDPYLAYFYEHISQFPKPYFATIFTLTSHHPFLLPPNTDSIQALNLHPFLKTMKYTDAAVGNFFNKIRNNPAFDSTLFIITADHTLFLDYNENRDLIKQRHIPLLFWAPKLLKPQIIKEPCSQYDILPSVIHLLHIPTNHASMGKSVFDNKKRLVSFFEPPHFVIILDSTAYISDNENFNQLWKRNESQWTYQDTPAPDSIVKIHKALFQIQRNLMLQDRLFR